MEPGGGMAQQFEVLERLASKVDTEFYCGDTITVADVILFVNLSAMRSGCGAPVLCGCRRSHICCVKFRASCLSSRVFFQAELLLNLWQHV